MTFKIICKLEYVYVELFSSNISTAVVSEDDMSVETMTFEFDYLLRED